MPADEANSYWEAITIIEAQQMLLDFKKMDWPNMKRGQRQSLHKDLYKMAYPKLFSSKKKIQSTEDLSKIISGRI